MKSAPRYMRLIMFIYICVAVSVLLFVCIVITKIDNNYYQGDNILNILDNELTEQNAPHILARRYLYKTVPDQLSAAKKIQYRQLIFHEKFPVMPSWDDRNLLQLTNKARYKAFDQRIKQTQYTQLVELLNVFFSICERNNIVFMLYGGSLLGSYRHFGLIPWDDDIDVLVNTTDRHRLKKLLSIPDYSVESPHNRQWKFYKKQHVPCNQQNVSVIDDNIIYKECNTANKWPYIDIFMFSENDTHIWDSTPMYQSNYIYYKRDVFPILSSPFEGMFLPVPKCPLKVLSKTYNIDLCVTPTYSHVYEYIARDRQLSVPCKRLYNYFPFVFETKRDNCVYRKLLLNTEVLYEVRLLDPFC